MLIAFYHYVRIFDSWVATVGGSQGTFNEAYRYVDWILTVPLLVAELVLVLRLDKKVESALIQRNVLYAFLMIATGYIGEMDVQTSVVLDSSRTIWGAISTIFFVLILRDLFGGIEAEQTLGVAADHRGLGARRRGEAELRGDDDLVAHGPEHLADERLVVAQPVDLGVDFFDTADVYGNDGLSERVIGACTVAGAAVLCFFLLTVDTVPAALAFAVLAAATREPLTVREDDDLNEALDAMLSRGVRRAPVVDRSGALGASATTS